MDMTIITIIVAVAAIIIGIFVGKAIFAKNTRTQIDQANQQAERIIAEGRTTAENLKKDKLLEAKERFLQMKADYEKEVSQRSKKIEDTENRIRQKENSLNQKAEHNQRQIQENEAIKENLQRQIDLITIKRTELEKHQEENIRRLEKVAGLSAEEARGQLVETLKEEARSQASSHIQEILEEAKIKANKEAKKIIIQTIQRTAAEQTIENAITVFNLESDELKGQIIGREGRNIRALEAATGVDLVVDDTPEAIV
jgi:ribonuclease Y